VVRLLLGLFTKSKKQKQSLEEIVRLIQQGDTVLQNELIHSYKPFIAKTVSTVCKRYIHESDDEFSIGLIAFNEAIQKYNQDKGHSLISFSEVLIKRKVIDYIRQQSKHQSISLEVNHVSDDEEYDTNLLDAELSIDVYHQKQEEEYRRDEIYRFTEILHTFNLTFKDLIEQSPKHVDARDNAINVAKIVVEKEQLKEYLLSKKRLPIRQLEKYVSISRKTIERNRKYIIAISLILIGDYVYLKDYIKGAMDK